ncbi:MAG TPA: extracellular solute-binding protein [Planctomycetota bacterium]|jgi:ABC-type Fe3+ transport system substrate-binding protein
MRTVWITLFCVVVLGLALGPALFSRQKPADEELVVISPHWDGIRNEFARAFSEQYEKKTGKSINVVWLDIGATGEIRKYLNERFNQAKPTEGIGADILFGGGADMLPGMADKNYFEPYPLPAELLKDIPESVNGQSLRDAKNRYHAACLSCFGFVYNKLVIERAHLITPQTWDDLGDPGLQGWVICGNPAQSGSIHASFEIVLQGQGWDKGYRTLTRMASNVRAFNEGGSSIPRDVSLGQSAVGPSIDFYASAPIRRQGASFLQFVVPPDLVVATPDCIAMMRNPPNHRAAAEFMHFVLSEEGQKLWYQARGQPGGPQDYDLERLPIMPKIYDMGLKTYTVINPFKIGASKYDSRKVGARWSTMDDLWRATMIDPHEDLWNARKAIIGAGREADLGQALCRPPLSEEAITAIAAKRLPAGARNALRNKWSAWARKWYAAIRTAAEQNRPTPEFTPAAAE